MRGEPEGHAAVANVDVGVVVVPVGDASDAVDEFDRLRERAELELANESAVFMAPRRVRLEKTLQLFRCEWRSIPRHEADGNRIGVPSAVAGGITRLFNPSPPMAGISLGRGQ